MRRLRRMLAIFTALSAVCVLLGNIALPCGVALADGKLRRGDKGAAVVELQKLLKEHDCFNFDEFTGYFGASTEAGVRKFQTLNGLKVDGVAGADTWAKLKQAKDARVKNPDSLCLGMSGAKVEEIQARLIDLGLYTEPKTTGYYGPATVAAVKAFQEASGMTADGIVGAKTKTALFSKFQSTTLIPGMKGDAVKKLQERLKSLGYFMGQASGLYGQITVKAVTYYQKLNGLGQDGICGRTTYNSIFDKNARTAKDAERNPTPSATATPTAKPTSTPKPTASPKPSAAPKPTASAKPTVTSKDSPAATGSPTPAPTPAEPDGQSKNGQAMGQKIVEYAKLQLGKKYVYGTAGPNTFDCTGLTCYVYKHFGVTLPRSASSQGNTDYGLKITTKSLLMPGDLVFFRHSDGLIGHAGLYIGGDSFIEAPYTGQVVKISSLSKRHDFAFARRVFK